MINVTCSECGRYLLKAYGTVIASVTCPNSKCKKLNQIKRVSNNPALDIRFKFVDNSVPESSTVDQ